eukprot:tig00021168_g19100.t1
MSKPPSLNALPLQLPLLQGPAAAADRPQLSAIADSARELEGGHAGPAQAQTTRSEGRRLSYRGRRPSRSGSIASARSGGSATPSLTGKEADDLAEAEMLKIRKFENVLFSVIYAMTARSGQRVGFIEMLSSVFGLAISDFFFLISLTVNNNSWEPAIIVWLSAIQNSLKPSPNSDAHGRRAQIYFSVSATWMFWMGCASVLLTGVLCAYAWQTFKTNHFPLGIWPIKLLRVVVKLQLTAGYILLLKLFASGLLCQVNSVTHPAAANQRCLAFPNVLYLGVALLMLLFFLPLCAVLALVYHDSNPRSIDPEARVHGRGELLYLAVRTFGVFFNMFFPSEALINFSIAAMTGAAAAYFVLVQPFYNARSNEFRIGLLCAACVFSLSSFALGFVGRPGELGKVAASALCMALVVAAFPLGILAARARIRMLSRRHRPSASSSSPGQVAPGGLEGLEGSRHGALRAAPAPLVPAVFLLDTDVEILTRFLRDAATPAAVDEARAIFLQGLAQFKTSSFLHLTFAKFLVTYGSDSQSALAELKVAWSCKPKFDMRFFLSSIRRDAEQQAHSQSVGDSVGLTYVQILEFRTFYGKAQAAHQKTLQLLSRFWASLRRASLSAPGVLDEVHHRLEEIRLQMDAAQRAYASILSKFGTSKALLRSYGKFCEDVLVDPEAASTFYRKADEIEHKQMLARRAQQKGLTGADAASVSESESSKRSSSQGSAAAAARRRRRPAYVLAHKETKAVKKLSWGILGGMLTLVVIGAVLFAVSKLLNTDFSNRVAHSRVISMEAAYLADMLYGARSLSMLAANVSATAALLGPGPGAGAGAGWNETVAAAAYERGVRRFVESIHEFEHPFIGLWIFAYYPSDIPVVSDAVINDVWTKRPVQLVKVESTNPLSTRSRPLALYDAVSLLIKAARDFAHGGLEAAADPANNVAFRSLVVNALEQIVPTLASVSHLVADRLIEATGTNRAAVCALFGVNVGFVLFLCLAVFEPAFRSVAKNQRGVHDILESLPRHFFKERARHYSKAKACFGADENDQSGVDEAEEERRLSPRAPRASRRARLRGAPPSDGPTSEEGDEKEEEGQEEEQAGSEGSRGGGGRGGRGGLDLGLAPRASPVVLGPEPPTPAKIASGGSWEGRTLVESIRIGSQGELVGVPGDAWGASTPAVAISSLGTAPDSQPAGAGPPGRRRGSSLSSGSGAGGAVAGAALAIASAGLLSASSSSQTDSFETKVSSGDGREAGPTGLGGPGGSSAIPSVAILRRRSGGGGPPGRDEAGTPGPGAKVGFPAPFAVAAARAFSLGELAARGVALDDLPVSSPPPGPGDGAQADAEAEAELELEGLLRSLGPAPPPPRAPAPPMLSSPSPSPTAPRCAPGGLRRPAEGGGGSGSGSGGSDSDEGDAASPRGSESVGEARGRSIIAALRRRYLSAFAVIAAIAAANFAVSFYFVSFMAAFASDVLYATERRQLAQTALFYAREAFIEDGVLGGGRERTLARLAATVDSLAAIHAGLKHGNATLGLMGADNRYLPQDKLNHYPVCSIQPARYGGDPADIDTRDGRYGLPCPFATPEERNLYGLGLDPMMQTFLQWLGTVLGGETCVKNRCSKAGWARPPHESPELAALDRMWAGHLRGALEESIGLFFEETNAKLALVEAVQAAVFAFTVAFLAAIYLLVFRPMVRRLQLESSRTVQLLAMIPKSTVGDVRYLQQFFRRVSATDDGPA